MSDDLEKIKQKFFVDPEKYKLEEVPRLLERLLPYCQLDLKGKITLRYRGLTAKEKIFLLLAARALGSVLEPSIVAEVSVDEMASNFGIPKEQVWARLKELRDERFVLQPSPDTYRASSHVVEEFLDVLDNKYAEAKKR